MACAVSEDASYLLASTCLLYPQGLSMGRPSLLRKPPLCCGTATLLRLPPSITRLRRASSSYSAAPTPPSAIAGQRRRDPRHPRCQPAQECGARAQHSGGGQRQGRPGGQDLCGKTFGRRVGRVGRDERVVGGGGRWRGPALRDSWAEEGGSGRLVCGGIRHHHGHAKEAAGGGPHGAGVCPASAALRCCSGKGWCWTVEVGEVATWGGSRCTPSWHRSPLPPATP